ncbi:hypothetical protein TEA_026132 [Camellia sinensis var. sinensis]|uniref:Uncharacterized protein n=1 Tax=Camellia sinensis var. sinensis TaxID=542762 RepID=A0A4S4EC40_CAMSN|nr:hypothetical protein TEA_026132 [Camellia sinensis var. sinensis]
MMTLHSTVGVICSKQKICFTFVKELTLDVENVVAPPKPKSYSVVSKASSTKEGVHVSSTNANHNSETPPSGGERIADDAHSEDSIAQSPANAQNSPSSKNFRADGSPHARETQSEHGGVESVFSGDRSVDERNWGAFDTHYDTDSGWDFSSGPIKVYEYFCIEWQSSLLCALIRDAVQLHDACEVLIHIPSIIQSFFSLVLSMRIPFPEFLV